MSVSDLPTLNAALNTSSAAFILVGWILIRSGHRDGHRLAMLGAFACSTSRTRSGRSSSCPSFS